jgi:predicted permease
MLETLSNSLVLLTMIALGYLLKMRGVIGQELRKPLLMLILNVTIPCAIVSSFDMRLDIGKLLTPFLLTCAACLLVNGAAILLTRGQPGKVRALTLLMTCGYFVAPFSFPFVQANMPHALMAMAVLDVGQSLFNMGTNYVLASALVAEGKGARFSPLLILRSMLRSAPLLTYAALLILRVLDWQIPGFVLNLAGKAGGANMFLSMLFIGLVLDFRLDRSKLRQLGRIFVIRYGTAALVSLVCLFLLPIDPLYGKVITLGLLAPVSGASMAYSEALGCDSKLYGAASSISFVVAALTYAVLFVFWA